MTDVGQLQLGTLGGGNHFVEFQSDADDRLWLMIHSGSRAMGQAVKAHHLARAMIRSASMMALDADISDGRPTCTISSGRADMPKPIAVRWEIRWST
jgi:RNA-splicing ligase RtcB